MKPQVGRVGNVEVVPYLSRRHGLSLFVIGFCRRVGDCHSLSFFVQSGDQLGPFVGVLDGVGQGEPGHGVGRVGHQAAVLGCDAEASEPVGQRSAAHQHRAGDARLGKVLSGLDHHGG